MLKPKYFGKSENNFCSNIVFYEFEKSSELFVWNQYFWEICKN